MLELTRQLWIELIPFLTQAHRNVSPFLCAAHSVDHVTDPQMTTRATSSVGDPHSPRSSQSPPPEELGAVHDELLGLENALYNLGTTVLNDSTKEKPSLGGVIPPKPAGARV